MNQRVCRDSPPTDDDNLRDNLCPSAWRRTVLSQLGPEERVQSWFAPDLNERLQFGEGLIVLTNKRLLVAAHLAEAIAPDGWRSWSFDAPLSLRASLRAGLGRLELCDADARLAVWHYTPGHFRQAQALAERFANPPRESDDDEATCCAGCGEPLTASAPRCKKCGLRASARPAASLLKLGRFARPRAAVVCLGFTLTLASTAAGLVPPYLTMPLMDRVLIPRQNGQPVDYNLVLWYLFGLAGAALLAWLLGWARTYVLAWVSERISADLRNQTYAHLQRLSLEFFGGKRTGDLMARVSSDTDRICNFLSLHLLDFGTDLIMIAMTAAILLAIDPWLALVTLCPFPAIAWLVQRVRNHLRRGFHDGGRAWGAMTSVLADTIPGIRVVKAFAQEGRETERFRKSNDRVLQVNDRVNRVWAFFGPLVTLLTEGGLLVVWAFGAWRVAHDQITVGVLTMFLAYISRFYSRLDSMSRMVAAVQRASASAERIFEILDRTPSVAEPASPVSMPRMRGEIEFCGVGFQYGKRPILEGVSLKIRAGEMIGLVGPSGAGKSTLVNLACRFYDPTSGVLRVDGVDIREFGLEDYRRRIGIVLQEPFLFFGTIAENIAYGKPDATRREIVAAARAARAHEFILRLPDGYDSLVGERGQKLSGGERQRISIARALLIDPRILILDEATSSVDTETEREIQEALDNLIRGRTTIAIAHRLSTLRKADRIVVLQRGRIAEIGPHDELIEQPGVYARLHRAQVELVGAT